MVGLWAFLDDPNNREVLAWVGGAAVTLLGGLWAVFKYWRDRVKARQGSPDEPPESGAARVTAVGGVASGGDLTARDITISGRSRVTRERSGRSGPNAPAEPGEKARQR